MGGNIKMMTYFVPIVIGFFFALALQKAGLGHYHKIVNQFRFTDNTVMKLMMTAISVGLICLYTLKDLGFIQLDQVASTYILGNLLGGLLFGIGMAVAGTCPRYVDYRDWSGKFRLFISRIVRVSYRWNIIRGDLSICFYENIDHR